MAVHHNPNAGKLIDDYIEKLPDFSKKICTKLRIIVLSADPEIIEDWKWGPNYYKDGIICGFGAFKSHVTLTFFQGSLMKDPKKIFNYWDTNARNRSIKFTEVGQVDETILMNYIREAVSINTSSIVIPMKGFKR